MKILMIIMMGMFLMVGCVSVETGDTVTTTDSYNEAQEDVLSASTQPYSDGTCPAGYFYCSIEETCLPATDGASCPLAHTDEEEAEAEELNDNEALDNNVTVA